MQRSADELLPENFKETVQLLIRLEFLTEEGTVTSTLSNAKRMALCLTGIPSELMTRLLETGINVSLAGFRRFIKEALTQKRSKDEIAAAVRARRRGPGALARPRSPASLSPRSQRHWPRAARSPRRARLRRLRSRSRRIRRRR